MFMHTITIYRSDDRKVEIPGADRWYIRDQCLHIITNTAHFIYPLINLMEMVEHFAEDTDD